MKILYKILCSILMLCQVLQPYQAPSHQKEYLSASLLSSTIPFINGEDILVRPVDDISKLSIYHDMDALTRLKTLNKELFRQAVALENNKNIQKGTFTLASYNILNSDIHIFWIFDNKGDAYYVILSANNKLKEEITTILEEKYAQNNDLRSAETAQKISLQAFNNVEAHYIKKELVERLNQSKKTYQKQSLTTHEQQQKLDGFDTHVNLIPTIQQLDTLWSDDPTHSKPQFYQGVQILEIIELRTPKKFTQFSERFKQPTKQTTPLVTKRIQNNIKRLRSTGYLITNHVQETPVDLYVDYDSIKDTFYIRCLSDDNNLQKNWTIRVWVAVN